MKLRIHDLVNDSIVDGQGLRLTVFTQGCPHHCIGCHNPQTHNTNGGYLIDINNIVQILKENPLLDGITLSGGEPFLQSRICGELARRVKQIQKTVWTYTGYTWEELMTSEWNPKTALLLHHTDVLVDGRFIQEQRSLELQFCGSRNQRLIDVPQSLAQQKVILWQISEPFSF